MANFVKPNLFTPGDAEYKLQFENGGSEDCILACDCKPEQVQHKDSSELKRNASSVSKAQTRPSTPERDTR